MRALVVSLIVGAVVFGAVGAGGAAAGSAGYEYADDFSTNAVEGDSYSHAPLQESFCSLCVGGWLMFVADSTGNRGLGFYPSSLSGGNGSLLYRLPREGDSGTLAFDLSPTVQAAGTWGFDHAQVMVGCGNDSTSESTVLREQIASPGHYSYSFVLTGSAVWIYFLGRTVRLDNLEYASTGSSGTVPASRTSWGRMKSLYR